VVTRNYRQQAFNYRQEAFNYRQEAFNYRQEALNYRQEETLSVIECLLAVIECSHCNIPGCHSHYTDGVDIYAYHKYGVLSAWGLGRRHQSCVSPCLGKGQFLNQVY
jgi:hypothetical protein